MDELRKGQESPEVEEQLREKSGRGFDGVPESLLGQPHKNSTRQENRRESLEVSMESTSFTVVDGPLLERNFQNHLNFLISSEHKSLIHESGKTNGLKLVRGLEPTARYMLGGEFIITALIASAAIARVREEIDDLDQDIEDIEEFAYGESSAETKQSSFSNKVARIQEDDAGLSGSLTDYMFKENRTRPTFIIGRSDSLVSISELLYQDGRLAFLISDLNKDKTLQYHKDGKHYVETKVRSVLSLPLPEDLENFRGSGFKDLDPNNLVTIVHDRSLDRELLEEELKPVVDAKRKVSGKVVPGCTAYRLKEPCSFEYGPFLSVELRSKTVKLIVHGGIKVKRSLVIQEENNQN